MRGATPVLAERRTRRRARWRLVRLPFSPLCRSHRSGRAQAGPAAGRGHGRGVGRALAADADRLRAETVPPAASAFLCGSARTSGALAAQLESSGRKAGSGASRVARAPWSTSRPPRALQRCSSSTPERPSASRTWRAGELRAHDAARCRVLRARGRRSGGAGARRAGRRQRILAPRPASTGRARERGLEAVVGVLAGPRAASAASPGRLGAVRSVTEPRTRSYRSCSQLAAAARREAAGPGRCARRRCPASGRRSRAGRTARRSGRGRRAGRGTRASSSTARSLIARADARRARVDPDQPAVAAVRRRRRDRARARTRCDSSRLPRHTPPRRISSPRRPKSSGRMFTPVEAADVAGPVARPASTSPRGCRAGP